MTARFARCAFGVSCGALAIAAEALTIELRQAVFDKLTERFREAGPA